MLPRVGERLPRQRSRGGNQATLFPVDPDFALFPATRYQGSKRKLAGAILRQLQHLPFHSVLDAFGGTGSVSYALKCEGKAVTFNDLLAFNHQIGLGLIQNRSVRLAENEIESVCARRPGTAYGDFIERTFEGIYFTSEENRWLDCAVGNISRLQGRYRRAMAWFALGQSALAKRPYNLFHRCNLYMRTAKVVRGFGNKASWDRRFADHFRAFAAQANEAVFDTGQRCRAIHRDVMSVEPGFDLVYIDPPYINHSGTGVDYRDFYHFLEGLVGYDAWPARVDYGSKHRRLAPVSNGWSKASTRGKMFRRLFERFAASILAVSYRSDGIPSIDELAAMLRSVKPRVKVIDLTSYQYALSTRRKTREMLLIGTTV